MNIITTQFKLDTGMKVIDVAKSSDLSMQTVRFLIEGKLKGKKSTEYLIYTINQKTNIPTDILRKYANSEVELRNEVLNCKNLQQEGMNRNCHYTLKVLLQKVTSLENQVQAIIGE